MRTFSIRSFIRHERGTSAVEFAIVSMPFIFTLIFILQIGIYFMAKSSLDAGTVQAADYLINTLNAGAPPSCSTLSTTLKSKIVTKSGGLVHNDTTLKVAIQQLITLSTGANKIVDATCDTGTVNSVLALRTQSTVPAFLPGMKFSVYSAALVRRQGS